MKIILDTINLWSTAQTLKTSNRGLSASNQSLLGIKKLRELILELAVRGKLVSQDPNDEPASELLKQIAKEKARLIKEGKIKRQEVLPEVGEDEKPFDLPVGWEWVRIRSVGHDWGQKTPDTDFTYIEVSAIDNTKGEVKSPTILTASEAPSRARKIVKPGTVIYSTVRPYLKNICVIDQEYSPEPIASTAFAILHPYLKMPGRFFLFYLQSPVFVRYVESEQIGIAYPAINDRQFFGGLIPLPPLAEQHRIVAKVDELMALCDELEKQQADSNAAHETLVEALLSTLTNAESPAGFDEAWQRIATHFDTLLTTEHSIDQLKQTILQLAIMGKLVPQNPEDEPATELLKKIDKEKARLVKEGKIKRQEVLPEVREDEKPFELPEGWYWVRLGTYGVVFSGNSFKSEDFNEDSGTKVIKITNAGVGDFVETNDFLPSSFLNEYEQYVVKENDLILALTRPYISTGLKISKCPKSYNNSLLNQRVAAIRVNTGLEYVFLFLQSSFVLNLYMERFGNSGLQPNLKVSDVTELILPIPPLAEQHRIVSKVNELFSMCDELKERLVEAQTLQNQMAVAVVEKALN